jgi:type IV pilus assembly protein PilC
MKTFVYSGIDAVGKRYKGKISAINLEDAERKIAGLGVDVLSVSETKSSLFIRQKKVSAKDIITMTFQLEQLLRSGVPLIEVLADMKDAFEPGYFRDVLLGVHDGMINGATFSEAISRYPDVFDEVYVNLVGIGEKTGKLENVLHDLGMTLRWQDELASKAKKIMVYPSIVLSVVLMVITFLMIFLVPQLVGFITSMGEELGFLTLSLIAVSDFFVHYWHVFFGSIFLFILAFRYAVKTFPGFRFRVHRWLLSVHLIGPILFKLKIARMSSTMAMMYAAGVSLQETIRLASKVVGNDFLSSKLHEVEKRILDGSTIADSFAAVDVFPPLILKLIKVGETTGRMDEAMRNVSYFYDREAKELIEKLEPAIEPIITLILAGLVAWVMMATLGPVYDIMTKIK